MTDRGAPTPAQDAARTRNWRIRNLRALYALTYSLTGPRRERAHKAIDRELKLMGARTDSEQREHAERDAYRQSIANLRRWWREREVMLAQEDDIPF